MRLLIILQKSSRAVLANVFAHAVACYCRLLAEKNAAPKKPCTILDLMKDHLVRRSNLILEHALISY